MSDGPSYLVHQPDGTTFGPADVAMLKEWVSAGIVTRTTALSIQGDERRTPAAVVPGLFEPEHQGQATTQPAEQMYQAHLASGTTDALTLADLGRMVEAGDVVSTTPISLVGGSKKVPAAVVSELEDVFRRREESASLDVQPVNEQPVVHRVERKVEAPTKVNGLASATELENVIDAPKPTSDTSSPTRHSAEDTRQFLLGCVIAGVTTFVISLAVIALDGRLRGETRRWSDLVFLLLVVPIQRWGANLWSCLLVPAIWFGILATITLMSSRESDSDDRRMVLGGICGTVLGIWYAAILCAIWFGPHPLTMPH